MKRFFALILLASFAFGLSALAESQIDLDGMTYDQLLDLRAKVDAAIWASDEWEEVTVPVGVYQIGRDIPAGRWKITASDLGDLTLMKEMDETGDLSGFIDGTDSMESGESVIWDLHEGTYLRIRYCDYVFSHALGADLGFK